MKGLQRFVKNSGKWAPPRDPNLVSSLFWVSHCIIHQLQTWLPSNGNLIPPQQGRGQEITSWGWDSRGGTSGLPQGQTYLAEGLAFPANHDFNPRHQLKSQTPRLIAGLLAAETGCLDPPLSPRAPSLGPESFQFQS